MGNFENVHYALNGSHQLLFSSLRAASFLIEKKRLFSLSFSFASSSSSSFFFFTVQAFAMLVLAVEDFQVEGH